MMKTSQRIAYLAPEIPALSATFVYQEIMQLESLGLDILPVSIHRPASIADSDRLKKLAAKTCYLYEQSFAKDLFSNLSLFFRNPCKYTSTLFMVLSDAEQVGLFSHIGKGLIFRFFKAGTLARYLKKHNVSYIHANFAHIPTDIAMYAARMMGCKFSFTSHANDLFERGWLLKDKIARAAFSVTISDYNKRFLIEQGADESKINVIHCGVDTKRFTKRADKPLSKPLLLGSLGRMVEKKGFDDLILACELLHKQGLDFRLQIAGDGPLQAEIEALIHARNLEDRIELIGPVAHSKVPEWLKTLDVFVLACKQDKNGDIDGIPVVLMEAMLSGVPVISTTVSGIPELIIDNQTGQLSPPESPNSIAEKIRKVITDKHATHQNTQNALKKVNEDFELSTNTARLRELLKKESPVATQV